MKMDKKLLALGELPIHNNPCPW